MSTTTTDASTSVSTARWGLPLVAIIVGMFMSVLDVSIVNVAIPKMQKDFGTTMSNIQWITTAYTLCLGVTVPASAWLADRFGLKRIYLLALVAFSAASALCGLAWDLNSEIVFRVLQAVPGGVLPVVCLTMVYRVVPKAKIGVAMGMYGFGLVVAPAVGPALGGWLVDYVSWRLIFYLNVPIGLLGAVAAYFILPNMPTPAPRRFDILGLLTVAGGLAALLLAFSKGEDWDWISYRTLGCIVAGILLLALFVVIELEVPDPLLDVRVFRNWEFVNSLLLIFVLSAGLFSALYFVPLFLQDNQNLEAFPSGLLLLPQAVVMLVLMPIAGRLFDRFGARWLAVSGLLINGVGTLLMTHITPDMTHGDVMWWMSVRAAGLGLSMIPVMTGGLSALPPDGVSQGSALNNLVQRVTAALALPLLTAISTQTAAQDMAGRAALPQAQIAGARTQSNVAATGRGMGLATQVQAHAVADSYANIFLILTWLTFLGAGLAVFLRSGPPPQGAAAVEAG